MTSGTLDNSEDSPRGFGHGISDRQQGVSKMGLGRRLSMCDRYAVGDLDVHVHVVTTHREGTLRRSRGAVKGIESEGHNITLWQHFLNKGPSALCARGRQCDYGFWR
jgi:hypothetical protein